MPTVLFTSDRELSRAENLKAVWDAYDGDKVFKLNGHWYRSAKQYDLMVTDEYPTYAPNKCIYIGHGMGAGKTAGLDQPNPYFKKPKLLTYAIASSEEMIPIVMKQCGIKREQVVPIGMPRTDAYFSGLPENSTKTHLYAPTFREGEWFPDLDVLSRELPKGHKLVVKLHMLTGDLVRSRWANIEVASAHVPTTPYLKEADSLITDYSSILFDAMVMRKPVILYAKDISRYLAERGMYMPYPDKYSPHFCMSERSLAWRISDAKWNDRLEELRQFYVGACDGHSTERVIDLMRSML